MRTRVSLGSLCVLVLTVLNVQGASDLPGLLEIGTRKQLFIDDYMIQSLTDAQQVLNPATKARNNPVVRPDRPWEGGLNPYFQGPVRREGGPVQDVVHHDGWLQGR